MTPLANRAFRVLAVLLGAYALALAAPPVWDGDVFWHLRVGEWIVQNRALPDRDLFSSLEPDRP